MIYATIGLVILLVVIAIYAVLSKSVVAAIVAVGVFSFVVSVIFVVLQAPDVAMTQAVVGAGLTTAFFVIALDKTNTDDTEGAE
ncbi:MAG: DUF4040 domain-containing protein [Spirochaetaceae bacterium]|nr:MAG: DUF4040 domain-containing protein [Spirochaetaceae bacterium]